MTFPQILATTLKHEGYYANIAEDRGGETYRGIARKYHPSWEGWLIVDNEKARNGGSLPWNHKIVSSQLDRLIYEFYYTKFWKRPMFDRVFNKPLAAMLFDFHMGSGYHAIRITQEVLNLHFGKRLVVDGAMGSKTLEAINSSHPDVLRNEVTKRRVLFYKGIVRNDPSQAKFEEGWIKRALSFVDGILPANSSKEVSLTTLLLIAGGIATASYFLLK